MGEVCAVVIEDIVVADLRDTEHDLALVDLLARLTVVARREGVALAVWPCDDLRALLAACGLSGLDERR